MEEEQLDYVLVPLGLLVFGLYNVWLLFTVLRFPRRTVIGINAETRHQWVFSMMSVKSLFSLSLSLSLSLSVCTLQALTSYVYIYIYVCVCARARVSEFTPRKTSVLWEYYCGLWLCF